jgi:hypothetical protein
LSRNRELPLEESRKSIQPAYRVVTAKLQHFHVRHSGLSCSFAKIGAALMGASARAKQTKRQEWFQFDVMRTL